MLTQIEKWFFYCSIEQFEFYLNPDHKTALGTLNFNMTCWLHEFIGIEMMNSIPFDISGKF